MPKICRSYTRTLNALDLSLLARAIAKAKGRKPATYMRKMSTFRNPLTGATCTLRTKGATPYPIYAIRNPKVALWYNKLK